MSLNISTPGLALYSIPAAWVVAFYPNLAMYGTVKNVHGFTSVQPRGNVELLKDTPQLDEATRKRLARMYGAHQNGMENLPIWIGAVLAAHIAGLPHRTLNIFAAGYLGLRMLYNHLYFNQSTEGQGKVRSLAFFAGLALPLTLFIKSANKLRATAF